DEHRAGRSDVAALRRARRTPRRPPAGRFGRTSQVDGAIRAGARPRVLELCDTDDRGRAEATLPRQALGSASPPPAPGAHARGEPERGGPHPPGWEFPDDT